MVENSTTLINGKMAVLWVKCEG